MEKVRQPFNINSLIQAGAIAALDDHEHLARTKKNNAAGLAFFSAELPRLKLEFVPSAANFVLVRVGHGQKIFEQMQRQGVITRPMGGYKLSEWIRVTIGTPEENRLCLAALRAALEHKQ
jgi:histidinol-phosphate aminotransferase